MIFLPMAIGCRGNNPINSFSGSNELTDVATCVMNSDLKAGEVAIHKPNEFGIYDMSGNVNEWCWDWYDVGYYSRSPFQDPTGPTRGSFRVLRGGAWFDDNQPCGVSIRSNANPGSCEAGIGFRVVKTAR